MPPFSALETPQCLGTPEGSVSLRGRKTVAQINSLGTARAMEVAKQGRGAAWGRTGEGQLRAS